MDFRIVSSSEADAVSDWDDFDWFEDDYDVEVGSAFALIAASAVVAGVGLVAAGASVWLAGTRLFGKRRRHTV